MDICESIIRNLENIGVEYAFGGSGAGVADFVLALKKSKSIRGIMARHEQGASFMACGYAMFSDKLGVCFATPGPGAFNMISGICVAYSDSIPLLAITGYETSEGVGKGGLGETTGLNRTPDSRMVFSAMTKKSFIIRKASDTCDILEEALNLAFEGRPGPVHIHIPFDIGHDEVPNYRDVELNVTQMLPLGKQVKQFADVLEKAIASDQNIVALLGYGCVRSHAADDILAFLEKLRIPFMTTMDAKGILPEDHELSLGMTGAAGDPGAKQAFLEADVVLAIGNSFSKWQTWRWAQDAYENKLLLQINIDKVAINRVYPADLAMLSDAKPAIRALAEELDGRGVVARAETPIKDKHADQPIDYRGELIHPGALCRELSKRLPPQSIVLGDAGAHMLWLASQMQLCQGQIYQNPGIFGPMGSHVNASIGIQCANPDRCVIVGCGDGDYQMGGFEFVTAVEHGIPVVWIIFNNGEYNIIKMMQLKNYNDEAFNDFLNPDFAAYARACGGLGFRVEKLEEFGGAFDEALAAKKPAIIDVVVDPAVYPPFGLLHKPKARYRD